MACEFSGRVRDAFQNLGHDAWSCDFLPSDTPGNHIQGDILENLNKGWDLMIAHPPCTWLCAAMRTNAKRKDRPEIAKKFEQERDKSFSFVMSLWNSGIEKIAIENPIGYLSGNWKKPSQIIRPFLFGHPYKKDICLWLKNLPPLYPTVALFPPLPYKTFDVWSTKRNPNGRSVKSITFPGIASAMAEQWG